MKIKHLETLTKARYFHGSTLPCVVRIMKSAPSNEFIALHGHEFSELVLVSAGSLKHLHKKKTEVLKTGDFLIVHPGTRHGYAELASDTVVYNLIFVDSLREYVHLLAPNPLLRFIFPPDEIARMKADILGNVDVATIQRAVHLLEEIRTEEKSPSGNSSSLCGALFASTIALLSRGLQTSPFTHQKAAILLPELAYLNAHLNEKITVKQLCDVAGKSPSTLNRHFLSIVGKSPIDYLISRRLDEAEILCTTTEETLVNIAARCGFVDPSHLLRSFHSHGRTPPRRKRL